MARTPQPRSRPKNFITGPLRTALLKARDRILEEPKRLEMSAYLIREREEEGGPACGTVGCIAGWARLSSLSIRKIRNLSDAEFFKLDDDSPRWVVRQMERQEGYRELARDRSGGLTWLVHLRSRALFHVSVWPASFQRRYDATKTQRARARVTADRITYFVRTGE